MSTRSMLVADLPNELDDAFGGPDPSLDDTHHPAVAHSGQSSAITNKNIPTPDPLAYDFEHYDSPPPGSPQRPPIRALQNDYGNSNGHLPNHAVAAADAGAPSAPSFFRRAVGALLPSHYVRVPLSDDHLSVPMGGGAENDGVFANVTAKPQPSHTRVVQNPDGSVFMVPEDSQKEVPPSYAEAQADAVPPYWETTVHLPSSIPGVGNMIISDLPTGSFWVFIANLFISFIFQFMGFVLTYILLTSHAAKFGSRAGLGLTLIQFGFYSRTVSTNDLSGMVSADPSTTVDSNATAQIISVRDGFAFLFMTLGWFLFLTSVIGFWRIKRWECAIRTSTAQPTDIQHDVVEVRRNIANTFGISLEDNAFPSSTAESRAADERVARNLRAAGLI